MVYKENNSLSISNFGFNVKFNHNIRILEMQIK